MLSTQSMYVICLAFVGAYMWGSIRIFYVLHLWGLTCGEVFVYFMCCICGGLHVGELE